MLHDVGVGPEAIRQRSDARDDRPAYSGFFVRFPSRRLLNALSRLDVALREEPVAGLAPGGHQQDEKIVYFASDDDRPCLMDHRHVSRPS